MLTKKLVGLGLLLGGAAIALLPDEVSENKNKNETTNAPTDKGSKAPASKKRGRDSASEADKKGSQSEKDSENGAEE